MTGSFGRTCGGTRNTTSGGPGEQTLRLPLTRRQLILAGSSAAAALAVGDALSFVRRSVHAPSLVGLRRSDYKGHVGRRFRLSAPGVGALSIPLVAVKNVRYPRSVAGSEESFTLILRAPPGSPEVGQAVMTVRHPDGWSQRLLVSPASPAHHGLDYAAVINRARPKE